MSTKFQVDAFFAEFPFLTAEGGAITNPDFIAGVEEVAVARIDANFLALTPRIDGGTGNLVSIRDETEILLLDADGKLLGKVKQEEDWTHNEAHRDDTFEEGETVGAAVARVGPERVVYAVQIETGYEIVDHHSVGGCRVTLYKAPRGFTLAQWVEEQRLKAEQRLRAETAAIDAEGAAVVIAEILDGADPSLRWNTTDGEPGESEIQGDRRLRSITGATGDLSLPDGRKVTLCGCRTSSADNHLLGVFRFGERPEEDAEGYDVGPDPIFYIRYRSERTTHQVHPIVGGRWHCIDVVRPETASAEGWALGGLRRSAVVVDEPPLHKMTKEEFEAAADRINMQVRCFCSNCGHEIFMDNGGHWMHRYVGHAVCSKFANEPIEDTAEWFGLHAARPPAWINQKELDKLLGRS